MTNLGKVEETALFFSLDRYMALLEESMRVLNIPVPVQSALPQGQSASQCVLQSLLNREVGRLQERLEGLADSLGLLPRSRVRQVMEEGYSANRAAVDALLEACSYQGNNLVLFPDFLYHLKTHYSSLFSVS